MHCDHDNDSRRQTDCRRARRSRPLSNTFVGPRFLDRRIGRATGTLPLRLRHAPRFVEIRPIGSVSGFLAHNRFLAKACFECARAAHAGDGSTDTPLCDATAAPGACNCSEIYAVLCSDTRYHGRHSHASRGGSGGCRLAWARRRCCPSGHKLNAVRCNDLQRLPGCRFRI